MGLNTADRLKRLRQKLAEKELDGIFISQPENRYYLSGFDGSAGYLLITAQDAILATDFRYIEQAKSEAPEYKIFQITGNISEWFPRLLAEFNLKRLGFESEHLTYDQHQRFSDILNNAQPQLNLIPVVGLVESLRMVKEPAEVELIGQAVEISDKAAEYIVNKISPGMTEKEVAWDIEKFMRKNGSQSMPFDIIVASGPNSALPHAKPSERQIGPGEPVIMDIGARAGGYSSDLSRTICLGSSDSTFQKVYDTVLQAQQAAISGIKDKMTGDEADSIARKVIETAGYGQAFGHALGHGIGLAVHEEPRLGPNSTQVLSPGMVFSIEPGIYLPGWGGVRIEDLATIENGKIRVLSKARK